MSERTLRGRCALITGSVQGLGLAAARRFAQAGCHVAMHGLADDDSVASARRDIQEAHRVRTTYSAVDLRDPAAIEQMIAATTDVFGSIDILVNNAVVRHSSAIDDFSTVDWNEAIAVNLSAAFHTIRLTLPGMKRRNLWRPEFFRDAEAGLTLPKNVPGEVFLFVAQHCLDRAITASHCNSIVSRVRERRKSPEGKAKRRESNNARAARHRAKTRGE